MKHKNNYLSGSRFASLSRANRKRALSASPYSELDLSALIRYSPTSLHFLNGSPGSSGSYGHLSTGKSHLSFPLNMNRMFISPVIVKFISFRREQRNPTFNCFLLAGALSPALVHSAHLHVQQLHAHLIRSASASPFLSPQNSLQNSLLHLSAAASALQHHPSVSQASQQPSYMQLLGVTPSSAMLTPSHTNSATTVMSNLSISGDKSELSHHGRGGESKESPNSKHPEPCSNVVSSTMEAEDSRDGLSTLKVTAEFSFKTFHFIFDNKCSKTNSLKKCVQLYVVFVSMKFVSIVKSMP